jgi:ABC-type transporter Mla subunit MlaD
MSLYRQAGRARRRRRIGIVAGAAIVAVVVLVVVLASGGSGGPPTHADRVAAAGSAATEALDGLELLGIEYGQAVKGGQVVAATEYAAARSDVQRATTSLSSHAEDFRAVDPAAFRKAESALARVTGTVARRADIAAPVAAARAALQPFVTQR